MQRYSQQVGFLLEPRWSEMMDLGAYKMLREMSFPLWESVRWRFFYVGGKQVCLKERVTRQGHPAHPLLWKVHGAGVEYPDR